MWVPRSATADWPADDRIGISVLDCLQCDGTGTVRLDPGRGNRPNEIGPVTPRGPGRSVRRSPCEARPPAPYQRNRARQAGHPRRYRPASVAGSRPN